MSATPTSRVDAQLVMADGTTTNVRSVEYFSGHGMIWIRGQAFEQGGIAEVEINGRRHSVKSIENKTQVCEIRFERE
ncbi:hypothetical protein LL998_34035 (plasmid) [Burkholderia ambifaria]|uniref:hypothetical protein n=1 Tax=Burkholderia ambifaria TaxID=152480 RepID=UPI001E3A166C|nr:hypothetical protein [Burkholderia ambifaria]UEP39761.1 hypothetical protein LL998_34035 [Burkholderia ambifaria]